MTSQVIETQVAVIGGGITGAAIARELSKFKIDVCLIEREGGCGFGVTKMCQGLLHGGIAHLTSRTVKYHGDIPFRDHLLRPFGIKEKYQNMGRDEYFSLAHVLDEEVTQPGRLVVAKDKEDMEMVELIKKVADELDIRGITLLDKKGVKEMEPGVHPDVIGGLFDANESVILPMSWAIAFAENAEANGVHIYKNTTVTNIEDKEGYYLIETNGNPFKAEYVVNAAGLYADDIAKMVGVGDFEVSGWKAQLLVLENLSQVKHIVCATPRPQRGRMFIPTPHNSLIVAHTFGAMTHKEDRNCTREGIQALLSWLPEFLPSVTENQLISSFAGFLTFNSKNQNDHLLETPKRGFITAAISAPGLGPAPAIAREIVHMLSREGLELTTSSDFNPYRHKAPRFVDLPEWEKTEKIKAEPRFGRMVCRCQKVSEQEIREAVKGGARTLDEVKFKTLAGFGRCQGGFCTSRILNIMAEELKVAPTDITKRGEGSYILTRETKPFEEKGIGG